ncbi:Sialate O-acetylesterase [Chitinophaga sp. 180180018-2]|nr:Sialate O-acetylesterase [Chitinophaga sp. 212800010-3]
MHQRNHLSALCLNSCRSIFLVLLCCCYEDGYANIRLPKVIGNNMVMEQQHSVKIWGWADPMEHISITTSWDHKVCQVTATGDACWQVIIVTPAAGGPYEITFEGKNRIRLTNIMVGEVWVCGGQSNMEMCGQWGLADIRAELRNAANTNIRFFQISKTTAPYPQGDVDAAWVSCDSSTLNAFSAVGYFFGKKLQTDLHVPVGLISSCWGGTAAEVWTPENVIENDSILRDAATLIAPAAMCPHTPGLAWNAMVAPVTNVAIAGAIWYQGENNICNATSYHRLFTTMIDAWRAAWKDTFPFYYVQIAPFSYRDKNVGALLREAQAQSMQHIRTGMVVTTDLVDNILDVHPADKHTVGSRLANWALAEVYHRQGLSYKSPSFKSLHLHKNKIIISFNNITKGLQVRGDTISAVEIAGDDKIFYPANAVVKNNTLVVWNAAVSHPVAVRYCFSNTAIGNLFNKDGLPVAPFRTDQWLVETK